jgi:hypothetical protein
MSDLRDKIREAREAGHSDEDIVRYVQESENDPRIAEALQSGFNAAEVLDYLTKPAERSLGEMAMDEVKDIPRQIGLFGRHAIEGAGGLVDFAASPFRAAVNTVLPENMQASPVAPFIADTLGLPKPQGARERVIGDATQAVAAMGTGQAAAAAAKPITQFGQQFVDMMRQFPKTQLASATAAGGATGAARESGASPTGQALTGLAAGMIPGVGPMLATRNMLSVPAQTRSIAKEVADAGYTIPPSQTNPSLTNRVLEGLSGKIKTNQQASIRNQETTNRLAKKSLGIPDDQPLNIDTLSAIRARAGQAYNALETTGVVNPSKTYFDKLDDIVKPYLTASKGFPDAPPSPIIKEIAQLKSPAFDASAGVAKVRELRELSSAAYAQGDKAAGSAYRSAASAIEDALERHLIKTKASPELVKQFRDARKTIAKTYSVEKALNDATGNVSATRLASQLDKGAPLTDELRTAARAGQAFPKANQPVDRMGGSPPLSPFDFGAAALLFGTTGNPMAAASLVARPAFRSLLLSGQYQKNFGRPGGMLANPNATPSELGGAGLLGTQYGTLPNQ